MGLGVSISCVKDLSRKVERLILEQCLTLCIGKIAANG